MEIKNILIANRGEIAVRICRAAKEMGIGTLAIYSDIDGPDAYHCRMADRCFPLHGRELHETYLNINKIIDIAIQNGAEAIHPGYGFLSENHLLAESCQKKGLIFIGPTSELIRMMGNKIEARAKVAQLGIPVINADLSSRKELQEKSSGLEYPLLIKAAAGGGGKGMRIVTRSEELSSALETTSREANNYFGNGDIFLEKFIDPARHIEFQVLGDHHGNAIHIYERECSIQRRYQKIFEESPSSWLKPETRKKMGEAALRITLELGYVNAGTIEFLVDEDQGFYFLEMNTRIQVEHPVTERVSGIDLVKEQIRIAEGLPLSIKQEEIQLKGHAIEARIYAENPRNNFMPSPGYIALYSEPSDESIRMDSSLDKPATVFPEYDPMIAKMIVWGPDRNEALRHLEQGLAETSILGIETNLSFLLEIARDEEFIQNRISTRYCDDRVDMLIKRIQTRIEESDRLIFISAFLAGTLLSSQPLPGDEVHTNPWNAIGYWRQYSHFRFSINGEAQEVILGSTIQGSIKFRWEDSDYEISNVHINQGKLQFLLNGKPAKAVYFRLPNDREVVEYQGIKYVFRRLDALPVNAERIDISESFEHNDAMIVSPMYGRIVKVNVGKKDEVKKGDVILTIDSMKIENNIIAPQNAKIKKVLVKPGEQVEVSKPLLLFE